MKPMRIAASSLLVTALAAPARADVPVDAPAPTFALMDSTGDPSTFEVDTSSSFADYINGSLVRTNVLVQLVTDTGIGGYAGLSASFLAFEDSLVQDSALGSLQAGGVRQLDLGEHADVAVRVGLIMPTATEGDRGALDMFGTRWARPADMATSDTQAVWARLGASSTVEGGAFFARIDLGVDIPFIDTADRHSIAHVNLGAGTRYRGVATTAELQTAYITGGNDTLRDLVHTAAVATHYPLRGLAPFVAFSAPLDEGIVGQLFLFTIGVSFAL